MTNLKRIIDEKGVSQKWLAEQIGVTEVSMSRYISGERIPKAPIAIRMADILGVEVKELYGWDDKHVVGEPEQPETHEERTETHARDLISRQWLMECVNEGWIKFDTEKDENRFIHLVRDIAPSAQPELIEKVAYIRGFEQGRTQGMIDAQGHGRSMPDERIKYI